MNVTYEQMMDLVKFGMSKASINGEFVTFKYTKKVFYDNLWDRFKAHECRGITFHAPSKQIVLRPPCKSFNYKENGTWAKKPLSEMVRVYRKVNGFMASAFIFNGQLVVGTTGTTNSSHAQLARSVIAASPEAMDKIEHNSERMKTSLFEITHPSDPHIVEEEYGAHYLGGRLNFSPNGSTLFEPSLNTFVREMTLQEAIDLAHNCRKEGFMVYDMYGDYCKLKTPYYIGKKKLMRCGRGAWIGIMAGVHSLDPRWDTTIEHIKIAFGDSFADIDEFKRREIIEEMGLF